MLALAFVCCSVNVFLTPGPLGGTLGLWVWQGMPWNWLWDPNYNWLIAHLLIYREWSRENAIKLLDMKCCKILSTGNQWAFCTVVLRALAKWGILECYASCVGYITALSCILKSTWVHNLFSWIMHWSIHFHWKEESPKPFFFLNLVKEATHNVEYMRWRIFSTPPHSLSQNSFSFPQA